MNVFVRRNAQLTVDQSQIKFETRVGNFEEMCALLKAVAHSGAQFWNYPRKIEIELGRISLNPILQVRSYSAGTNCELVLPTRERALMGRITRHYAAHTVGRALENYYHKKNWSGPKNLGHDWGTNNPHFVLKIEPPSLHEKMEAVELLRDWLRQHWLEGEKHLERII